MTHLVDHLPVGVLQLQGQGEAMETPEIVRGESDLHLTPDPTAPGAGRGPARPGMKRLTSELFELGERIHAAQTRFP